MEATILLCDYAEEINGKLYIAGGGWTSVPADLPRMAAVAAFFTIPAGGANRPHPVVAELMTGDGEPATIEGAGMAFRFEGQVEGTATDRAPGGAIGVPLAFRFILQIRPGDYRFQVSLDGAVVGSTAFTALA